MNGDIHYKLEDVKLELNEISNIINKNKTNKISKYLTSYAIIQASGTIEITMKSLIFEYLINGSNKETIKFLENMILESSANPSTGQIQKLLQNINSDWKDKFLTELKNKNHLKSDLNSLVQLRNDFAHGNSTSGISIKNVIKYYLSGIEVLEILNNIIYNT